MSSKLKLTNPAGGSLSLVMDDTVTTDEEVKIPSTPVATEAYSDDNSIGVNQTWQDMTSSRAFSVVYTNGTGRPIMVAVTVSTSAASSWCEAGLYIDEIYHGSNSAYAGEGQYPRSAITSIIPAGSTYRVVEQGSRTVGISVWRELR